MPGVLTHVIAAIICLVIVHLLHFKWEFSYSIFIGNKLSPITIIAPITSKNTTSTYPFEVFIPKRKGLNKDSKVLLNQLMTIDKRRLIKKLTNISHEEIHDVDEAIKISLGL